MLKTASILINKNNAYLNAVSGTNFLMIPTRPFIIVDWSKIDLEKKYMLIMQVVNASESGLKFPESPDEYSNFVLQQFGVKSWNKLNKGSKLCQIQFDEENNAYKLTPYKTVKGGHEGIKIGVEKVSADIKFTDFMEVFERVMAKCE